MIIKGLSKVLKNMKAIQQVLPSEVDYLFIDSSLDWISKRANENLNVRTQNFWGSDAREWTKTIFGSYGILRNKDENSASIEFGIGNVGARFNGIINNIAKSEGWQYNVPSVSKDANGRWTFQDTRTGIWMTISGYQGKAFLYDAFVEYMQNKIWLNLYQVAFDKVMKGVI